MRNNSKMTGAKTTNTEVVSFDECKNHSFHSNHELREILCT